MSSPDDAQFSEDQLIERARSGDEDAFAEIVAVHSEPVYALLRRFGLDPAEAEEVAQEVFLRLARARAVLEFAAVLQSALMRLPAAWSAAVVLRDIEGLSTEAAAKIVGIRQTAFKSRLHRGRMQLRALLEPYLALGVG
ncbi:MAG TPA: sigma factor-like helix-turn-helix DNA-binding protein [Solirubrobacteraceae bacterium]